MNFDLRWKRLELLKLLLQDIRLLDLVNESSIAFLTHSFSIMWTVSMVTSSDFVPSPYSPLEAAGFAHFIKICLTNNMRAFVHDWFGLSFFPSTFFPSFLQLSLVAILA